MVLHSTPAQAAPKRGLHRSTPKYSLGRSSEISLMDLPGTTNSTIITYGKLQHRHLETVHWSASRSFSFKNRDRGHQRTGAVQRSGALWLHHLAPSLKDAL